MNNQLEPHELALLFPPLDSQSAAELARDIKNNGQRDAIVLFEGKILDGLQRNAACKVAEVQPLTENFETSAAYRDGLSPLDFVLEKNLHRRQLSDAQRALIVIEAEKARRKKFQTHAEFVDRANAKYKARVDSENKQVIDAIKNSERRPTIKKLAEKAQVNERTVSRLLDISERAPEKLKQIEAGTLTVWAAHEALPKTAKQKARAKEHKQRLTQGLHGANTIQTLLRRADANGGTIYVELSGYGIRCNKLCTLA